MRVSLFLALVMLPLCATALPASLPPPATSTSKATTDAEPTSAVDAGERLSALREPIGAKVGAQIGAVAGPIIGQTIAVNKFGAGAGKVGAAIGPVVAGPLFGEAGAILYGAEGFVEGALEYEAVKALEKLDHRSQLVSKEGLKSSEPSHTDKSSSPTQAAAESIVKPSPSDKPSSTSVATPTSTQKLSTNDKPSSSPVETTKSTAKPSVSDEPRTSALESNVTIEI